MPSEFSQQQLCQQLATAFDQTVSPQELAEYVAQVEIVEPAPTKQFWQTTDSLCGIYFVLRGKVRLLDSAENLITTYGTGSLFGEATLFPQQEFVPYIAKASSNLKLCYLKQEILQALIGKYPSLGDRLLQRAEQWDLVMLCRQNSQQAGHTSDVLGMLKALSLFERHYVKAQDSISLPPDSRLLLLQKGELRHSQGHSLVSGKIYPHLHEGNWQATQPTIAYVLKNSNWQTALKDWKQLVEFAHPQEFPVYEDDLERRPALSKSERFASVGNVIPFPQRNPEPQQKQKRLKPYFPSPKVRAEHWLGRVTKQYPFFEQHSGSDCGAACLVMISRYWGKRFSVNRLRDLANTSRDGVSLRNLAAAAETVGFASRPVKASYDKLAQQPLPAIAHWEGKHFVVIYEMTPKRVIIGDPAIGIRTITAEQFKAAWSGYALLLQPTALLKDAKQEIKGFWKFLSS